MMRKCRYRIAACFVLLIGIGFAQAPAALEFEGKFFRGEGDAEYLGLLDISRRMFAPDPEFQNIAMMYTPKWNGLVEGPTWNAWWIQNSYGTTYCALPFLQEPFLTFLQNSQDLWFDQMGDGLHKAPYDKFDWIPPNGCLCDAASPGWFVAKQGDGRVDIHDWGMEFTAAGLLMQSELLLISRNENAVAHYRPKLERCANFIETRRDPSNNIFLAGPAGNLLAPSYAGYKKPDGTYGQAYLAGLSITYIAALDRLIEVEKLAGDEEKAELYRKRRDLAKLGLSQLSTDEGYFIKSLDPDGTKHGVYGAEKYGYFEASPNHDAIAFRVVDDAQADKIYGKIASLPGLRPHDFIIANYPGLDDMYEEPTSWLWKFGTWVNGGHWSTCEARMIMAYYRLGKYEDARRSMKQLLKFAREFRMDNPLVEFGSKVYQPKEPINLCYDSFGPPAAMVRGLFEFLYRACGLTLIPHIPPKITQMEQKFPIRFGGKQLYLSTAGTGKIAGVWINGKPWRNYDDRTVSLPYAETPDRAEIRIDLGEPHSLERSPSPKEEAKPPLKKIPERLVALDNQAKNLLKTLYPKLMTNGQKDSYEVAHCSLAYEFVSAIHERLRLQEENMLPSLPEPSQTAADNSYYETAEKICQGLEAALDSYANSGDSRKKLVYAIWKNLPVAEVEEDVTEFESPNNGAGPLWCYGSPLIARDGGRIYVNASETGKDVPPLCNTRWRILERTKDQWKIFAQAEQFREREPCPLVLLSNRMLYLSINPSTQPPGTQYGPCEPNLLRFSLDDPQKAPEAVQPDWAEGTEFTDHSYRGVAADGDANEILLFNIHAKTGEQYWSLCNAGEEWIAKGKIAFPIRSCYPQTALSHRAGHIMAVGDIVEPTPEWRAYKKEKTGRDWDYVFRRLFYAWSPDLTHSDFHEPIEIENVDATAGHIRNLDLWIGKDGSAYLLYAINPVQNALMRDRYFPDRKLETILQCAIVREGAVVKKFAIAHGGEGLEEPEPHYARFYSAPDGALYVVMYVQGKDKEGKSIAENRIQRIWPEMGEAKPIPLKEPFTTFFTVTERGGSKPSNWIDLYGTGGRPNVLRYARVRL
ncbi:MAG: hypothetical protein AB1656_24840 [Candidatus Omnitrophota bacterium]